MGDLRTAGSAPSPINKGGKHAYYALKVLCAAVALGDGRVLAPEKGADGASDDVAAAENNGVLSSNLDASGLEEEHDSSRGAGQIGRAHV